MDVIVDCVMKLWVSVFGTPGRFLTDNGLEFGNEEFREMGEKLNTSVKSTAAEAPWSNGINERHNAILGDMIVKVMKDRKCSLPIAVVWSVSAKNSLANVYGYSPNQLVFGRNPSFPSLLDSKLPALDQSCSSVILQQHLSAMHEARNAFIYAESNEKLSRALRAKTRTSTSLEYENGQSVYYKRDNMPAWKGPGTVIGKEGKTVLVKHGSVYVRVHPSRLLHENSEFVAEDQKETSEQKEESKDKQHDQEMRGTISEDLTSDSDEEDNVNGRKGKDSRRARFQIPENTEGTVDSEDNGINDNNERAAASVNKTGHELPKKNQTVLAKTVNDVWKRFDIISRAGKATGKYPNHLNVFDKEESKGYCIDWSNDITEWKEIDAEEVLIAETENPSILDAKFKELEKWVNYGVYEAVENTGQSLISVRWVCTSKEGKVKARLVARGFEDSCSNLRTDSPTCSKMSMRLTIAVASSMKWQINSLDIQSAFLQGETMNRKVYLKPPPEANTDKVWCLNKCVYGLQDAARKWYLKATSEILKLGVQQSKYDDAMFYWHCKGILQGIMTSHVDDFFWAGTKEFEKQVISKLKSKFQISSEQKICFKHLGIQITQKESNVVLDQDIYIEGVEKMKVA